MNVSEGGLALTQFGLAAAQGMVTTRFELPGMTTHVFRVRCELVWRDSSAIGVRFLHRI
jgi:hypothetical protein